MLNRIGAVLCFSLCVTLHQALAEAASDKDKPNVYQQELSAYDLHLGSPDGDQLTMQPHPILNWVGDFPKRGSVFVWTHHGRPLVVGQCFSFKSADRRRAGRLVFKHTFHSLSEEPLVCLTGTDTVWSPAPRGIQFRTMDDAKVNQNKVARLVQMRAIGRQFKLRVEGYIKSGLRLLPQPLIRYESKEHGVLDGAIFSFSFGSDPESLLIVEAVTGEDGAKWQYAFARFNLQESSATLKGKQIWKVDAISYYRSATLESMKQSRQRQREEYVSFYSTYTEPLPKLDDAS